MDEKNLQQPLLPLVSHAASTEKTSSATDTNFAGPSLNNGNEIMSSNSVIVRLLIFLLIGTMSVWVNHESSKGFVITVVNNMKNTPEGKKFTLFYVSNDQAIRLVQSSSTFAAKILFPSDSSMPEKLIDQVDVQLVSHNLTNYHTVAVESFGNKSRYALSISSFVMEFSDFKYRIRKEFQKGMAEILLFNLQNKAPKSLLDGMVEYISNAAGFGVSEPMLKFKNTRKKCWEDEDSSSVAKFLAYAEEKSEGFVGRLNEEIDKVGSFEEIMDKLLGIPAIQLCASFHD
ncbi:uncharacterized protein LOC130810245 [Amaranthus tricolor]|uniref:uncharacterized protein LOC130810245 n=1 Tax=Amaranthus tricolor TaxID=29722 RepID=UPI002582C010|nr:uncharacterized protein LOC130810245 [Amaranthus tricolor]